ncbi:MAG: arginine--tRNA ligase [Deltaproteobacteria bacterium]|nr:arginine--tRNA ligase [Deltaproteobacteria bacterium]
MKKRVAEVVAQALETLKTNGSLELSGMPLFQVDIPKTPEHGDFATNAALVLAKPARRPPRQVAELIREAINPPPGMLARVDIAGPGFINFFLQESYWLQVLADIAAAAGRYGHSSLGAGKRVQVEFVSANPTGPLHVGHGRGAALGDALANILTCTGHQVEREYYINDVGSQMRTLGLSLFLRAQEVQGEQVSFPETCYQGDYIKELAQEYLAGQGPVPAGEPDAPTLDACGRYAGEAILREIRQDLEDFGVRFDTWYSETRLFENKIVDRAFAALQERGYLYEAEGALWFKATAFGDEKDRVVRRQNGATTYFASDIAYHWEKFQRGYDQVIDIWGADHHGYVPRLQAIVPALGIKDQKLTVLLVQLVSLLREGQPVAMTTRGGTFVTLRQVMDEVGKDVARFIFLSRRADAHLEFDLELAKRQTSENPVYYVQYAHARLASVFRLAGEKGIAWQTAPPEVLTRLNLPEELTVLKLLAGYPDIVEAAATHLEPHRITYCLTELAGELHSYYYKHRFISDDQELTQARLLLVQGVKAVLDHGLGLLGVEAPEAM